MEILEKIKKHKAVKEVELVNTYWCFLKDSYEDEDGNNAIWGKTPEEVYEKLQKCHKVQIIKSKKQKLLDNLIEIAKNITYSYPQKWGDCYPVNSTVAVFINKHTGKRTARIWQAIVDTRDEIYDSKEIGYTNAPHHVILTINYNDDNFYPEFDDFVDFSNVFVGKRDTSYYDGEVIDELSGIEDKKLMKLLEKAYADFPEN